MDSMDYYMNSGQGVRSSMEQVQTAPIAADYIHGMLVAKQLQQDKDQEQERKNQLQMQQFAILKQQDEVNYKQGVDALQSGDAEAQRQFAKKNPGVWAQVEADANAAKTKQDIQNNTDLKAKLGSMTFDQYRLPETQDRMKTLMGATPPQFKTPDEFNAWRMQASGLMDKLSGSLGTKYKLQLLYSQTHDPNIKSIIDEQDAKDRLSYEKQRLSVIGAQQRNDKQLRPALSFNDAFAGVSTKVDNDPALQKLGPDMKDPSDSTGKQIVAGPKTAAKTAIANIARDLYYRHPTLDADEANEHAINVYKFKTYVPVDKQVDILKTLWQHKDDPVYKSSFEKHFKLPADTMIEYMEGHVANGQQ